ncbi:MAG: metallophosphoesterase, partial [Myxococcota bacterium]|nr:metallophosphoesterase [Myxococcota bacterium]
MPAVFVSDVHLLETANPKDSAFLRWLESLSDVTLYILGDLFDLWWSFEDYVPIGYRAVCQCLRDKVQQGMSIYFVGGNRDFSSRYLLSLGIQPLSCGIYSIEGRSIYLAHGDEADRSTGYRLVKTVLRSRSFAQAMSWLGPEKGYRLLRYLKSGSAEVRLGGTKLLNYQKDWIRQ